MSVRESPNKHEWERLYQAAVDFKKSKCWEWMYDGDIFGVKDPESGEIGYCSIMGNAGEYFGVAAYLGPEGLSFILRLLSGILEVEDPENMFLQKCLKCSFENRGDLNSKDLKVIKELGLKFRGRNEWPVFRHYEPGLFPWFLNAQQCRFLTHILRQALDVALRCKEEKSILEHSEPLTFLVRVPVSEKDGTLVWEDRYLTPESYRRQLVSFEITDEIRIRKLRGMKAQKDFDIEADTFFIPKPVKEEGRPFYPQVCVLLNHEEGALLSSRIIKNVKKEGYVCIETLLDCIERYGKKPSRIFVTRLETYHLFADACSQIGIEVVMEDGLDFLEQTRHAMFNYFMTL